MPHILLETTSDLAENGAIPQILEALSNTLGEFDTIDPIAIKARHALRPVWFMNEGAPAGFAHLTVSLLDGRPVALRKEITEKMFLCLKSHLADSLEANLVAVSVEVREMVRDTYIKS